MLKRINLHLFDEGAPGEATVAQSENGASTEVQTAETQTDEQQFANAEMETESESFEDLVLSPEYMVRVESASTFDIGK